MIGDATSSVFYPGKLLFALPLNYPLQFKLYVTAHVIIASAGGYLLARRWERSVLAAGQCSLSYAFGGAVLFTYTNVVFLVGAAWLPFAIVAVDAMLVRRSLTWAFILAALLALMTLGGDPQSAYHAGLMSVPLRDCFFGVESGGRETPRDQRAMPIRLRKTPLLSPHRRHRSGDGLLQTVFVLMAIVATCGGFLGAVQILPSAQWSLQSERASFDSPRNIYEIPAAINREFSEEPRQHGAAIRAWAKVARGLLGQPERFTHYQDIYEASVVPVRMAELIWPNFSGKVLPNQYSRWLDAVFDAQWATPSLYMGLLPMLLAITSWRVRGSEARVRWMSWIVLLAVLGSFGSYGAGWVVNQLADVFQMSTLRQQPLIGNQVGGVYWTMVTLLPGYAQFRDPAKLWVIAALGMRPAGRLRLGPNVYHLSDAPVEQVSLDRTLQYSRCAGNAILLANLGSEFWSTNVKPTFRTLGPGGGMAGRCWSNGTHFCALRDLVLFVISNPLLNKQPQPAGASADRDRGRA